MPNCGPFRRMVILGDSNAYGMCAHEPRNEWNQVLAYWLRHFQDAPLRVFNRGLPAEVISPRCPGYADSAKPSLMERYQRHCIDLDPDLVVVAQSLNDMRAGMPLQEYLADLGAIVADIQAQTAALVVLPGVYHQIHGRGVNDPALYPTWSRWNDLEAHAYNHAIGLLAAQLGALYVDTRAVFAGADWTLHSDCCHLNDLGQVLMGNALFQVIATHCAGIADKTMRIMEEEAVSILNTGGADTDEEIQALWSEALDRFTIEFDDELKK